jgi:carbonic anhydrase/acetyltransferase-like protein (isoleucine patch superfamily)
MIKSFRGKTPRVDASAFVSEAAYIIGDVEIGENCSIWPGAVIRGDTSRVVIGKNTAVEDNCVIHSDESSGSGTHIGDNVNIGHGAMVHGKNIGNNVLVGINAAVLHGAVIGDFCLIGAGCVVSEKMVIPEGSFVVGVPAKIKGKVPEKLMHWLRDVPGAYAGLARQYKDEGL